MIQSELERPASQGKPETEYDKNVEANISLILAELPHDLRPTRPNDGGEEPIPATPSHMNAGLARAHLALATGVGSALAYGGLAVEAPEIVCGVAGIAGFAKTHHYMLTQSLPQIERKNGEIQMPEAYATGLYSRRGIALILSGALGFELFETHAWPMLMFQWGVGAAYFVKFAAEDMWAKFVRH